MRELIARVRANLRRAADHPAPPSQPFRLDGLTVDFAKHRVLVDNRPVVLTPTEFGLLAELIRHAGAVLMPADLLRAVWGPAYVDDFGLLRTAVWRAAAEAGAQSQGARFVGTVNRVGYTLGAGTP